MDAITREEMAKIGIDAADPSQPIDDVGAKPDAGHCPCHLLRRQDPDPRRADAALGQKQQLEVLRTIKRVRDRGDLAIVFITHNDLHAKLIGDRFAFLNRGKVIASGGRDDIDMENIRALMAGGAELADLSREFAQG